MVDFCHTKTGQKNENEIRTKPQKNVQVKSKI